MLVPANLREKPNRNSHLYELLITTSWRRKKIDLLIRVVGSENKSSFLWIRNTMKGLLRFVMFFIR